MDWNVVQRTWEKWASANVGSDGQPLKSALLLNYDPTGPSRLLSTIYITAIIGSALFILRNWKSLVELKLMACFVNLFSDDKLKETSAKQEGLKADPIELGEFVSFVKWEKLQTETFIIGQNEYLVTTINENWFSARCINTAKRDGEGVIVMQTAAFLLVSLYDGSFGATSHAMAAAEQLTWQLSRKNL